MLTSTIVLLFINLMICFELWSIHTDVSNFVKNNKEWKQMQQPATEEVIEVTEFYGTEQFKAWMDYKAITCKTSRQWAIQELAETDENGFRRIGDYYICAMGTRFGNVGDCFCVVLDSGMTLHVIKGDEKQDIHTLEGKGYAGLDGSVLEFIVDADKIHTTVKSTGDCSKIGLQGAVTTVIPVDSIIQWN